MILNPKGMKGVLRLVHKQWCLALRQGNHEDNGALLAVRQGFKVTVCVICDHESDRNLNLQVDDLRCGLRLPSTLGSRVRSWWVGLEDHPLGSPRRRAHAALLLATPAMASTVPTAVAVMISVTTQS